MGITGRGVEEGVPLEEYGWRRLLQKWRRWVIALTVGHGLLHPGNHLWTRDHTSLGSPFKREAENFARALLVDAGEAMEEDLNELWEVAEHQDFWERFHSAVK